MRIYSLVVFGTPLNLIISLKAARLGDAVDWQDEIAEKSVCGFQAIIKRYIALANQRGEEKLLRREFRVLEEVTFLDNHVVAVVVGFAAFIDAIKNSTNRLGMGIPRSTKVREHADVKSRMAIASDDPLQVTK